MFMQFAAFWRPRKEVLGLDRGFWLDFDGRFCCCRKLPGSFAEDLEFVLAAPDGSDDGHSPAVIEHHVVTWLQLFEPWRRSWHEEFATFGVPKQHYGDVGHNDLPKISVAVRPEMRVERKSCCSSQVLLLLRTGRWLGWDVLVMQKLAGISTSLRSE